MDGDENKKERGENREDIENILGCTGRKESSGQKQQAQESNDFSRGQHFLLGLYFLGIRGLCHDV
jgi:hypothetical protein